MDSGDGKNFKHKVPYSLDKLPFGFEIARCNLIYPR
jgi:hypothetical protein